LEKFLGIEGKVEIRSFRLLTGLVGIG